jgi:hypothetical protein
VAQKLVSALEDHFQVRFSQVQVLLFDGLVHDSQTERHDRLVLRRESLQKFRHDVLLSLKHDLNDIRGDFPQIWFVVLDLVKEVRMA